MELYLVRHTTPAILPGICYGRSDLDVHDDFHEQVAAVRQKLYGIHVEACYSSPQTRCRKLAHALGLAETQHDDRLQELHFGEWEMQSWDAIPRSLFDHWSDNFVERAPPGGETFRELFQRAHQFFVECTKRHSGSVVVVTHAGIIRALLAHALRLPLENVPGLHLDFGGVSKIIGEEPFLKAAYVNR
jgi:alpha-ribazole phosphatase